MSEACLARTGVIGVCLMALLSGFAAVSSLWQNFGGRKPVATEGDVARAQAGVSATAEMLDAKRSRLRALERKAADQVQQTGVFTKVMGSIRGSAEGNEKAALGMEIRGLETMQRGLESSLAGLEGRRRSQRRAGTTVGKVLVAASYAFSVYCAYRILATTVAGLRRWGSPDTTFSQTDPINRLLAIVAKHWDANLDRDAWARQISFLLSGVILLASISSVLQTLHLFTRLPFIPSFISSYFGASSSAALLVGQITATYVVSLSATTAEQSTARRGKRDQRGAGSADGERVGG